MNFGRITVAAAVVTVTYYVFGATGGGLFANVYRPYEGVFRPVSASAIVRFASPSTSRLPRARLLAAGVRKHRRRRRFRAEIQLSTRALLRGTRN
jgi:hypothetical protein